MVSVSSLIVKIWSSQLKWYSFSLGNLLSACNLRYSTSSCVCLFFSLFISTESTTPPDS